MGEVLRHRCSKCRYEVKLYHGFGMQGGMSLLSCSDCKRLASWMTYKVREDPREVPLQCPAAPKHFVEEWADEGPCPKCGAPMKPGEHIGEWD